LVLHASEHASEVDTETGTGQAVLTILGHSLPDTICVRAGEGDLRVGDLVEADASSFFVQGNPGVISVRNERAGNYPALNIEMRIAFRQENWAFVEKLRIAVRICGV
jgi:hypothetical protein